MNSSMDRPKATQKKKWPTWIWAGLVTAAIFSAWMYLESANTQRASVGEEESLAAVRSGAFVVSIGALGNLSPVSERLITASVPGTVEEVLIRPGQEIDKGIAIVRLVNTAVHEELAFAILKEQETKADHRVLIASLADARLAAEANVAKANAVHGEFAVRLEAEKRLLEKSAISVIEHQKTRIQFEHAELTMRIEEDRAKEFEETINAKIAASGARLDRQRLLVKQARDNVSSLRVESSMRGIVMDVLVRTGERLRSGDGAARVADVGSMIASVRVPEVFANRVTVGQPATVKLLGKSFDASVNRVDPSVVSGSVLVELVFDAPLPIGARPDLSLTAKIIIATFDETLFVRRPRFVTENSISQIFVRDASGNVTRDVTFGIGTTTEIQVLDGLIEGDLVRLDQ